MGGWFSFRRESADTDGFWRNLAVKSALSAGALFSVAVLMLTAPRQDATALFRMFTDQPSREEQLAKLGNRHEAEQLLISLRSADGHAVPLAQPSMRSVSCEADAYPVSTATQTAVATEDDFDRSLLPDSCREDYSYCLSTCDRNENGRIDGRREQKCQAFCVRQAVECEKDACQDQVQENKRSAFLWGLSLILIGIVLGFVVPPVGIVVVVLGLFLFGLSVAPIFDMINFMNCR